MPRRGLDTERVVAAAAEIADREGLDSLSMAHLASQLGVRAPSLYNHLDSLDSLRRMVAMRGLRELGERLRVAAVGRSGSEALRAFAWAYREYVLEHPGVYAATVRAPAPTPEEREYGELAASVTEVMLAVLRAWDLEGEVLIHAARAVRSALHGFVTLENSGAFAIERDPERSFEALVDTLVLGLGAAAATAPAGSR